MERNFGLETYETFYRGLDPQIGRFNSIDPKSEKYFEVSPYVSMNNNPVGNVDPRGDDWFVNTTNGGVVYAKGVSTMTQQVLTDNRFGDVAKNYERLGPDLMFGDNVVIGVSGNNVLDAKFAIIENPEEFMNERSYKKVVKDKVEEVTFQDKSMEGGAFDAFKVEQVIPVSTKILDSKITYVPQGTVFGKVKISTVTVKMDVTNTISMTTSTYKELKPFNKKNETTTTTASNNLVKSFSERLADFFSKTIKK
ncbi:hypothetical protein D3C86_1175140 [compost metagenome]